MMKSVVDDGEIIAMYTNDKPYPSYLMLGYVDGRAIHIVLGKDDSLERCIIVTAYEPDENIWQAGFKLKRD